MGSLFLMATWQYWQYSGQSNQLKANFWDNQVNRSKLSQAFKESQLNREGYFDGENFDDNPAPNVSINPKSLTGEKNSGVEESGDDSSVETQISSQNSQRPDRSYSNSRNSGVFDPNSSSSSSGLFDSTSNSDDSQSSYNGYSTKISQNPNPSDFGFKNHSNNKSSGSRTASGSGGGLNLGTSRLREVSVGVKTSLGGFSSSDKQQPRVTAQSSPDSSLGWVNPYGSSSDSLTRTSGNSNSSAINVQSNSSPNSNNNSSTSINQQSNRYLQNTYNYTFSGNQNNSSSSYNYTYSNSDKPTNQTSVNNYGTPKIFTPTTQNFNTGFSKNQQLYNQQTPALYTNPYSTNPQILNQNN